MQQISDTEYSPAGNVPEGGTPAAAPEGVADAAEKAGRPARRQNLIAAAICLLAAFVCITICSKASFLYSFHDGNDVNWFLTMGRGIVNGKVPYKDLFEQKGVLLYLLFALNYAISGNTLTIIYITEVICAALFAFACYKIAGLYAGYAASVAAGALSCLLAACSHAFASGGGEVEEYLLPALAYGLYVLLNFSRTQKLGMFSVAACGALSSVIFWTKYTCLFFFAALAVCVFVDCCINKKVRLGFAYAGVFIAAFAIFSLPELIYLGVNGALDDMWQVYIWDNLFSYSDRGFARIPSAFLRILLSAPLYIFAVFAAVYYFKKGGAPLRFKVYYAAVACTMFFFQCFTSGDIRYYHLVMAVYLPLGLVGAGYCAAGVTAFFAAFKKREGKSYRERFAAEHSSMQGRLSGFASSAVARTHAGVNIGTVAAFFAAFCAVCIVFGNCTLDLLHGRNYFSQFRAAEIMREEGGGSLLTYKTFDRGFYTAYDHTPQFYYFAQNNFDREDYPVLFDSQESYVINGEAEFVVTETKHWEAEKDTILSKYKFVADLSYDHIESNTDIRHVSLCLLRLI